MLNRFAVVLLLLIVGTISLWGAIYLIATVQSVWPWPQTTTIHHKFFEFDFAGYAFGLVAVAVSAAGVYVSMVTNRVSDEMMRVIELHYVPDPFLDRKLIEDRCAPGEAGNAGRLRRTAHVKVIYAITQLLKWPTLEEDERKRLLGHEGLDAEKLNLAKPFPRLQEQFDRKLVLQFAIIIAVVYATIPFLYFFVKGEIVVTVLFTLYILCIVEIVLCAALFYRRSRFLSLFEIRVGAWREDIAIYLAALAEEDARAAANRAGAAAQPVPTAGGH